MGSMSFALKARKVGLGLVGTTGLSLALLAAPASAQDLTGELEPTGEVVFDQTFEETVTVNLTNDVAVSIEKDLKVTKDLTFIGDITIDGAIDDISRGAFAILDEKQIIDNSSAITSDSNEAVLYDIFSISGNIQLNAGTGALINQQNGGAISDAAGEGRASTDSEIFLLQNIFGNTITQSSGGGGRDGYDNYAAIYELSTLIGNIQGNAAAGNAIQQANSLTIASANDSVLAEATAAVLQEVSHTNVSNGGARNYAGIWDVSGLSGNVQANVASGSAINQSNVMPIAHSAL